MALTVSEMREKTKEKRSQAVSGLINVIKVRDGSISPPIEGQKDIDNFNLSMLFGASQDENIDWNNMGVEGLIRLYYDIIEEINGTLRDNIITNESSSGTVNSCLDTAAVRLLNGTFEESGFFKRVSNKPEYDTASDSFSNNINTIAGDYDSSINKLIGDINLILGNKSPIGPHYSNDGSESDWNNFVFDSIMGRRWTDVCPSSHTGGDPIYSGEPPVPTGEYTPENWTFGNGEYDGEEAPPPSNLPSGFVLITNADFWNSSIESYFPTLITRLNLIITFIEYSKIASDDYFTNPNVILDKNETPQFNTQDTWISHLENYISGINTFDNYINSHKISSSQTDSTERSNINSTIEGFQALISNIVTELNSIVGTLNAQFGNDLGDSNTLRGHRFLWIKNVIDPNDGSKVAINGLKIAIATMRSNIAKAEEEFGLYGLTPEAWIPIPNIAGIQTYYLPDPNTLELAPVGYLIAWEGKDHVTSYNVKKSTDWNGSNGSWNSIETVTQVDANTGKVLTYYIDTTPDIAGGEKPYYKIKTYDHGGAGEMWRIPAESVTCDPKNIDDFPEGGETVPAIPGSPPEPPPITVPEIPDTVPVGTLIWTTILERDDAIDVDHEQYQSEVPFDSSGTNLVVYINGELQNRGIDQDYTIIDYTTIDFNSPIQIDDEVTLNVFLRNPDEDIISWKDPVETNSQLSQLANSDGDVRLVIDENAIYQWEESSNSWVLISGSIGDNWGAPVSTVNDLPVTGNDGEVRLVITEQSFYYYNGSQSQWINIISQSMQWKDAVSSFENLPTINNTIGDVRLVLNESKLYLYDGTWTPIIADSATITLSHDDLINMPDLEGIVADHDARYYTENEIDITISDLQDQINDLLNLVPADADELSSTFRYSGTIFRTGYLSHDGGTFTTLVPEQSFTRITKDPNFVFLNPDTTQFNNADKGILRLYINDVEVDSFDLEGAFDENLREDGQTYPPETGANGLIEILDVGPYVNYPTYQRGDFKIEIESSNLIPGENKIKLVHDLIENNETDDFILFWDDFTNQIEFESIGVSQESISSSKYLSGVRHYSTGDQFRIVFTGLNLFNNTYSMPDQIKINSEDFASDAYYINYQSSGVSGVTLPRVNEELQYDDVVSINMSNIYNISPRLELTGYDPHGPGDDFYTPYLNILINTFNISSDDKNEYFVDEHYRLDEIDNYDIIPVSINGQWNSQTLLSSGQLQVFDNSLVYPNTDFNVYLPSQSINYLGLTGTRYYVRMFKDTNPHNNGSFFIEGYNIEGSDVKIELKLPSQTGWLDLSKQYNVAEFTGIDGDGCLLSNSNYDFEWTSGGFSTANSGYLLILKVTMLNNTANNINQISINW